MLNKPAGSKNSNFLVEDQNAMDFSINNGFVTIESIKEIFKKCQKRRNKC